MTCSTSPGSRRGSFGSSGKTCSLPQVFTDVVESLRAGAEAKHLKLEAVLAGGTPQLIATDRLRLQQILVNLIDNAIKFTDRGGIRLTGRMMDRPGAEAALVLKIDDTGIGMTAEEMSGLFQPFTGSDQRCGTDPAEPGWAWQFASAWPGSSAAT